MSTNSRKEPRIETRKRDKWFRNLKFASTVNRYYKIGTESVNRNIKEGVEQKLKKHRSRGQKQKFQYRKLLRDSPPFPPIVIVHAAFSALENERPREDQERKERNWNKSE